MTTPHRLAVLAGCLALVLPSAYSAETPAASAPKDEPVVLSIFTVQDDKDEGYRSTQTISGSRTLADLRDTPNSISVLNREFLDDLIATRTSDALYYSIGGEIDTNKENHNEFFVFRGITATLKLRNGTTWYGGVSDGYNIERAELLRGPQAFLYGEGAAGGVLNQITKQAQSRNFERANLMFGSHDLRRGELDVNRKLGKTFAVRVNLAYGREGTMQHHAEREFQGIYVTTNWRPFKNTTINSNLELRIQDGVMGSNMLADGFSTTDRTGATTALTATTGGRTYIPALGTTYDSTARRRSNGTTIVLGDERIMPRELNFLGPDSFQDSQELTYDFSVDQKIAQNLNVQLAYSYFDIDKWSTQRVGSSAGSVYRDSNATLPSGAPNPYFNEFYTEYYAKKNHMHQFIHYARITGVYELKLPYNTQKIVASYMYQDALPNDWAYSEFVDPASGFYKGTLRTDLTLAGYTANNTVLGQNFLYRRFYLKDGDGASLTKGGPIAGLSKIQRDANADGATGRLSSRLFRTPAYGAGTDGSYFGGRVHTLIGWRHSSFNQDPSRDFYNPATGETYKLDTPLSTVRTRIDANSINYGAVVHFTRFVAGYYNFAESISLSSGVGSAQLTPGLLRGPQMGNGKEIGLRWAFLGGKLESNWTYFVTKATKNGANPAVPVNVRQTELGAIFGSAIDVAGGDTQSTKSTGIEVETVANLTKSWRLTCNLATTELVTADRFPQTKAFQALARQKNVPTPDTDAFLASAPDGTPLPGYTKRRANLVTMYRFTDGALKNFSIGGGAQYRDRSYLGNFDLNQDGVAEMLWSRGYTLCNLMLGYRTKILRRNVDLRLNINNLLDKDYYRSFALATGAWGDGRNFRGVARIEF